MPYGDNSIGAPLVPAGTESTVFGDTVYPQKKGQASNEPNEGEQEAGENQQTNSTMVVTSGEEQTITFEELAAKKGFKSPDDLAKSYAELERKRTKESMDHADLLRVKEEASRLPEPTKQVVDNLRTNDPDLSQDEAVKIVERMIEKRLAPLREKMEIKEAFKNPDDMKFASEVAKLVRNNPQIPWDIALDAVKHRLQSVAGLKESGRKEAYATIQQKQLAQSPSIHAGPRKEVDVDRIIQDKSVPFSEVQKIMRERFAS